MTNTISKPTWLYKPINVEKIQEIQKEFQFIHETYYSDLISKWVDQKLMDHLFPIEKQYIINHAPEFINLLKILNLYDRWALTIFSPTAEPYNKKFIAHIDNKDWVKRSYGLNLPVQNCHDSSTVFYKTKTQEGICGIMPWYPEAPCFLDDQLDEELGRLPSSQPAFVNVTYPHRPQTDHGLPRLIASTRFHPELHDYDFDRLEFAIDR